MLNSYCNLFYLITCSEGHCRCLSTTGCGSKYEVQLLLTEVLSISYLFIVAGPGVRTCLN